VSKPTRSASMAETREALLRAGEELFGKRGLDGPSLDDICAAAGKTRGAFYVHFEDRDAFLVAVMERIGLPLLDELFAGDDIDLATVATRFVIAASTGQYPLTKKGGVRPHQLVDACVRSPEIRRRYVAFVDDAIARLAEVIERDRARGRVAEDLDPRGFASALLAVVIGAQTMDELGVAIDFTQVATSLVPRR
jgi:TetR/AcrR family transcriptional repressor of nem operon